MIAISYSNARCHDETHQTASPLNKHAPESTPKGRNECTDLHSYNIVAERTSMEHPLFCWMAPGNLGTDTEYDQTKKDYVGDTTAQNDVFVANKGCEV